jgi:carbamoyl-phosphate synthase small subunit
MVTRVPHDHDLEGMDVDGILISNGPGDPAVNIKTIENVKGFMDRGIPTAGICLGCQIIALSAGGRTFKLPFGHRSHNQPCQEVGTEHCVVTSQNHGYAIDDSSLPEGWEIWYRNLNDGTVEGIKHSTKPFMAVQFHPEASPGPTDPGGLFDMFLEVVKNGQ